MSGLAIEGRIENLSSSDHGVHTTAKRLASCRGTDENCCETYKKGSYTCKACKPTGFFFSFTCRFVTFSTPSSSSPAAIGFYHATAILSPEGPKTFLLLPLNSFPYVAKVNESIYHRTVNRFHRVLFLL